MKSFLKSEKFAGLAVVTIILSSFAMMSFTPDTKAAEIPVDGDGAKSPVLIELFTSEGCHSCPPAEELVNQMIEQDVVLGADVIALQFHVDYWNYIGWEDPYSDEQFSNRQREYAQAFQSKSIYTPQMVVDGQNEFVGSHSGKALDAIDQAKRVQKTELSVTKTMTDEKLNLDISTEKIISASDTFGIFIAIAESNLVQNVTSGENRGKTLEHHGVVRSFHRAGFLEPNQKLDLQAGLTIPNEWKKENLSAVVFLQHPQTRQIAAVSQINLY